VIWMFLCLFLLVFVFGGSLLLWEEDRNAVDVPPLFPVVPSSALPSTINSSSSNPQPTDAPHALAIFELYPSLTTIG